MKAAIVYVCGTHIWKCQLNPLLDWGKQAFFANFFAYAQLENSRKSEFLPILARFSPKSQFSLALSFWQSGQKKPADNTKIFHMFDCIQRKSLCIVIFFFTKPLPRGLQVK